MAASDLGLSRAPFVTTGYEIMPTITNKTSLMLSSRRPTATFSPLVSNEPRPDGLLWTAFLPPHCTDKARVQQRWRRFRP